MSLEVTRNPMAYDFEPVRRERQVQLVRDLDEPPLILSGVESVGNTAWWTLYCNTDRRGVNLLEVDIP